MIKLIFSTVLLFTTSTFACREGYESEWPKSESFLVENSKWIRVVEITKVEKRLLKKKYFYNVIKNLKGENPNNKEGDLGPFPFEDPINSQGSIIWQDKGCIQYLSLDQGKQYILFSTFNNPYSVQLHTAENEARIVKYIGNLKK